MKLSQHLPGTGLSFLQLTYTDMKYTSTLKINPKYMYFLSLNLINVYKSIGNKL